MPTDPSLSRSSNSISHKSQLGEPHPLSSEEVTPKEPSHHHPTYSLGQDDLFSGDSSKFTSENVFLSGKVKAVAKPDTQASPMKSTLGKLFEVGKNYILQEIGFGDLKAGDKKSFSKKINLPAGTGLALKVNTQEFDRNSPYIQNNILRRKCAETYRSGQSAWRETSGILELGNGTKGTFGLGAAAPVSLSAGIKGLVKYRCLSPDGEILSMPLNSEAVKAMPVGREFELIGTGGFTLGAKYQVPNATQHQSLLPSWAAGLSASGGINSDYSLMIQRLPGDFAYVRYCVAERRKLKLSAAAKAEAKVFKKMPNVGEGVLKFMLKESAGKKGLLNTVKAYSKANAEIGALEQFNYEDCLGFQIDLSNKKACEAFEKIQKELSFEKCIDLAKEGTHGILFGKKQSEEVKWGVSADLSWGEDKIFLYEAITQKKDTNMKTKAKKIKLKDRQFSQNFATWFHGSKSVSWQSVGVAESGKSDEKNYYHLVFKGKDKVTEIEEVEEFISFARSLGIKMAKPTKRLHDMSYFTALFSDADDSEVCVDMYFTDAGIAKIDNASKQQCKEAYLTCMDKYNLEGKSVKNKILQSDNSRDLNRYRELKNSWVWTRWWNSDEMEDLEFFYERRNPGREIAQDVRLLTEAEEFADRLDALNEKKNPDSIDQFFTQLGWQVGFDYMKTLAAMAELAGKKDTVIHELSMRGGDIRLASLDEGEITHPSEDLAEYLVDNRPKTNWFGFA